MSANAAAALLDVGDDAFARAWLEMPSEAKATLPIPVYAEALERYRRLTPYVGESVKKAERGQKALDTAATRGNGSDAGMVHLQCGADVVPEAIRWLWLNNFARGKFHLFAGAPGTAKTTLALAVLATLTRPAGRWPDGTLVAAPVNGLIWSGEDDVADTLVPRLMAMGADMSRVYFVGDITFDDGKARPFDPARDMQSLEMEAQKIGDVGLLIVDPVVQAVAGDSHKNTEVRRSLAPLTELARRLDAAAIGISHFTKGSTGRDPVERVTGSVAFGALPRAVFAAAKTTDDTGNVARLFVRAKSNIGPDGGGFTFDIKQIEIPGHDGITGSCVLWTGAIAGTARDLLAAAEMTDNPEDRGATDEATDWLRDMLADGAMKASDVQKQARAAGISDKGLRRAREKLGIRPKKQNFTGGWIWSLPAKMPEDVHTKTLGTLGMLGTFEDAHSPPKNHQDAQDALKTGEGREGTFGGKCPRCAGEGCQWCSVVSDAG